MSVEQELHELVERARSGDYEPFQDLLDALRQRGKDSAAGLRELARSSEPLLRRAALCLVDEDTDEDVLALLASLIHDPAAPVRQEVARALEEHTDWPFDSAVGVLLSDG